MAVRSIGHTLGEARAKTTHSRDKISNNPEEFTSIEIRKSPAEEEEAGLCAM